MASAIHRKQQSNLLEYKVQAKKKKVDYTIKRKYQVVSMSTNTHVYTAKKYAYITAMWRLLCRN